MANTRPVANSMLWAGRVELLASEPTQAEHFYRLGLDIARHTGEVVAAQAQAPGLANALCAQGKVEEAARHLQATPEPGEGGSNRNRAGRLTAEARVFALRGEFDAALRRAKEAAALVAPTDLLDPRPRCGTDTGGRAQSAGDVNASRGAFCEAILLYPAERQQGVRRPRTAASSVAVRVASGFHTIGQRPRFTRVPVRASSSSPNACTRSATCASSANVDLPSSTTTRPSATTSRTLRPSAL